MKHCELRANDLRYLSTLYFTHDTCDREQASARLWVISHFQTRYLVSTDSNIFWTRGKIWNGRKEWMEMMYSRISIHCPPLLSLHHSHLSLTSWLPFHIWAADIQRFYYLFRCYENFHISLSAHPNKLITWAVRYAPPERTGVHYDCSIWPDLLRKPKMFQR